MSNETYKKDDPYDGTQEGPLLHGVTSVTSGTITPMRANTSGDAYVELTNATIEQTTGAAHNDLSIAAGGKDESGNVRPVRTDTHGNLYAVFETPRLDAFGRFRISEPETLFDSKQIHDSQPLFWDDAEVSGGSTGTAYNSNQASTTISVGATTAGKRVRQTFMRFNYQPGKSQLVLLTGVLKPDAGGTGIVRSMGYFDDKNGLFLRDNAGTIELVRRTYATGSAVNTAVAQSAWNIDPMDGTGPSGVTLDFSKTQIFFLDFEWLGVGSVRFGFVVNGIIYHVHQMNHANSLSVVYMSSPNLPLRFEIENTGAGAASSLVHICASVMSEGGVQDLGILRHKDSGSISGLATGTVYATIGLRLQAAKLDGVVKEINQSCISTTQNDQAHWEVRLNPTVAGTFTYSDETNSIVQTAVGASTNTVTGGTALDGGYFSTASPPIVQLNNALRLGASIAGTADTMVLCIRPITNNITVETSLTWREFS